MGAIYPIHGKGPHKPYTSYINIPGLVQDATHF